MSRIGRPHQLQKPESMSCPFAHLNELNQFIAPKDAYPYAQHQLHLTELCETLFSCTFGIYLSITMALWKNYIDKQLLQMYIMQKMKEISQTFLTLLMLQEHGILPQGTILLGVGRHQNSPTSDEWDAQPNGGFEIFHILFMQRTKFFKICFLIPS